MAKSIKNKKQNIMKYVGILNQLDDNNPIATVLENSIGNIIWTRTDANGNFKGTLPGAFPQAKTVVLLGQVGVTAQAGTFDPDFIYLAVQYDNILIDTAIVIEVYP